MLFEKQIIDQQLYEEKQLQHMSFKFGDHIEVQPIEKFTTFRIHMRDTEMYDPLEKDVVAFRILSWRQVSPWRLIRKGNPPLCLRSRLNKSARLRRFNSD